MRTEIFLQIVLFLLKLLICTVCYELPYRIPKILQGSYHHEILGAPPTYYVMFNINNKYMTKRQRNKVIRGRLQSFYYSSTCIKMFRALQRFS